MPASTVTSRDGTSIAFERMGSGRPLVLVDGALCSRAFGPMPKIAPLVAEQFRVYLYDRRGRGDSGDARSYVKEREIEDLEAVIGEAGGSACVLGLSSGAALALESAASGVAIEKLVVYEPPYMVLPEDSARHANAAHQAHLERLIAANERGDAVKYFMRDMVGVPAVVVFIMRFFPGVWSKLKAVAPTLRYDAAIMGNFSLPAQRLGRVRAPTLVIGGEKSDARLRAAVDAAAKAVPNAQLRMLRGQTHNVSPQALVPAVTDFLAA
jgi:pimeloyl-ACP methyl ester carboxylesterase